MRKYHFWRLIDDGFSRSTILVKTSDECDVNSFIAETSMVHYIHRKIPDVFEIHSINSPWTFIRFSRKLNQKLLIHSGQSNDRLNERDTNFWGR